MLSSAGLKGDTQRSREIGFAAYLSKPFTRDELVQVLVRLMGATPSGAAKLVTHHAPTEDQLSLDVLLVEDNEVNKKLAITLLTRWGHRVTYVGNGLLAVDALAQHRFDLVLMDMMMPVMDGLEATRRFRATELGRRTPIVAMTANATQGDHDSCMAAGMDDYIAKPIETAELQRLLHRYAHGDQAVLPLQAEDKVIRGSVGTPVLTASEFDYALALARADQEVVDIIAEAFIDQWPRDLQKMEDALLDGNLKPVLHIAHALKGTLFGARPPVELAQRVEKLAALGISAEITELIGTLHTEVDQLLAALRRTRA